MAHRIEVSFKQDTGRDTRAEVIRKSLVSLGLDVSDLILADAYTFDASLTPEQLERLGGMLANPVIQDSHLTFAPPPAGFKYALRIEFLPGVTDNVGSTAREGAEDLLGIKFDGQGVYTSRVIFLSGNLTRENVREIGKSLANPLIQRVSVIGSDEFKERAEEVSVPKVRLDREPRITLVDILNAGDDELAVIGKQGIANPDGTRRGPLAMDLDNMKAVKTYFAGLGRNPTDFELETLSQGWSEHCEHTIFADPIDKIKDGLFRHYIKGATETIRRAKGENDFCISVFEDNGGVIKFDEKYVLVDKAETHNTPSRLDGYGGAGTGIGGVIRDSMGTGLGALTFVLTYNFCFADPEKAISLFRGAGFTQPLEQTLKNFTDVVRGVRDYGNESGIPTTQGTLNFDPRYVGKPLVFVRAVGVMPKESAGRPSHQKKARPGDYIVMAGGRVGKDGIHGATFSSEAMHSGSPATAVQIGDPITQKKLNDVLIGEARDLVLYNSITDNGAGGLSCSVTEMATESGGFYVRLEDVPSKYPGLDPWEIWISESQERMTLAVPPEKWPALSELMKRRGVEATVIGEFTDSGKCIVDYKGERTMDIDLEFLHDGRSKKHMKTTFTRQKHDEPKIPLLEDLTESLHAMLARKNIAGFEFISRQYDHEVQGGSVMKPLQGRGRVNGDASVTRPVLDSKKGVVLTQGINPSYSDIDTYNMAACAIDTAVRNAVAAGADLKHLALLDNFCWSSSNEAERLGQLKRAVQACYDIAVAYGTPFISGKDSMFNDFKGFDGNGKPVKISVPPTLLVSAIGVINDVRKAVSLDAKFPGDLIYVLGENLEELGGSEYFAMIGEQSRGEGFIGNKVPQVNPEINRRMYGALSMAIDKGLVASAQSIHRGGLGVALAKTAIGGQLGMEILLARLNYTGMRDDFALFSEAQGRVLVTVSPAHAHEFEKVMEGNTFANAGVVRSDERFVIYNEKEREVVGTKVGEMTESYRQTFRGY